MKESRGGTPTRDFSARVTMPTPPTQAESNQIVQNFMGFEGDSRGIRGGFMGDSRGIQGGFEGNWDGIVGDSRGIQGRFGGD